MWGDSNPINLSRAFFEIPTGVSLECVAMPVDGSRLFKLPQLTGALRVSSIVVICEVAICFPVVVLGDVGWCYMEALVFMFNSPTFPLALVVIRGKAGSTFFLWQWRMCVMKMHDQSIVTIKEALLWLLKLFFLYNHVRQQELHREPCTIISCKLCCHRVQHSLPCPWGRCCCASAEPYDAKKSTFRMSIIEEGWKSATSVRKMRRLESN